MKKEINKKFDIASFETLESNGNIMLKGGFSSTYDERFVFGGGKKDVPIVLNDVAGCGCTINNNTVPGCACK